VFESSRVFGSAAASRGGLANAGEEERENHPEPSVPPLAVERGCSA